MTTDLKKKKNRLVLLTCALLFFIALFVDLATKAWAEYYFGQEGNESFYLIPGFMRLTLQYNSGMAFSMFNDNPLFMKIITWLTLPLMLAFGAIVYRMPAHYNACRLLLSVVTAGAAGNFFDRLFIEEGVRDFMDVSSIHFGVCNFADYFLSIGGVVLAICLVVCMFMDKEEAEKKKS